MVHHGDMDKNTSYTRFEAVACAGASLLLGAYLATAADNLLMQVILMSFPPAALAVTLRRGQIASTVEQTEIAPVAQPVTFEEVTASLEIDILTRAS